jgi:hypothetical protein
MHLAFQFGESQEPCAVVSRRFPMSRNGKHLGHVGGLEVLYREPAPRAVYGELLTLLSIFCQRRSECAKATVLHFIRDHQAYSLQAVALPSLY